LRILAVDTSGKEIGMGVFEGGKSLYERYTKADRAYNKHIMPMTAEALLKAGVKLEKIDIFAAALGPGSFTGIRVGMAVMKAFSHGLNRQFAGFSTLDIMAHSTGRKGRIWAVLEAGRNEVYAAKYHNSGLRADKYVIKTKYLLLSREDFFKKLKKGDIVACLEGENIMIELNEKGSKMDIVRLPHVDMKSFAGLIEKSGAAGKKGIYETAPVYIRASAAEEMRKTRAKNGGKVK
jgi:tRNA threonylcarbamoyladenosine biosynthesis protein TsaB